METPSTIRSGGRQGAERQKNLGGQQSHSTKTLSLTGNEVIPPSASAEVVGASKEDGGIPKLVEGLAGVREMDWSVHPADGEQWWVDLDDSSDEERGELSGEDDSSCWSDGEWENLSGDESDDELASANPAMRGYESDDFVVADEVYEDSDASFESPEDGEESDDSDVSFLVEEDSSSDEEEETQPELNQQAPAGWDAVDLTVIQGATIVAPDYAQGIVCCCVPDQDDAVPATGAGGDTPAVVPAEGGGPDPPGDASAPPASGAGAGGEAPPASGAGAGEEAPFPFGTWEDDTWKDDFELLFDGLSEPVRALFKLAMSDARTAAANSRLMEPIKKRLCHYFQDVLTRSYRRALWEFFDDVLLKVDRVEPAWKDLAIEGPWGNPVVRGLYEPLLMVVVALNPLEESEEDEPEPDQQAPVFGWTAVEPAPPASATGAGGDTPAVVPAEGGGVDPPGNGAVEDPLPRPEFRIRARSPLLDANNYKLFMCSFLPSEYLGQGLRFSQLLEKCFLFFGEGATARLVSRFNRKERDGECRYWLELEDSNGRVLNDCYPSNAECYRQKQRDWLVKMTPARLLQHPRVRAHWHWLLSAPASSAPITADEWDGLFPEDQPDDNAPAPPASGAGAGGEAPPASGSQFQLRALPYDCFPSRAIREALEAHASAPPASGAGAGGEAPVRTFFDDLPAVSNQEWLALLREDQPDDTPAPPATGAGAGGKAPVRTSFDDLPDGRHIVGGFEELLALLREDQPDDTPAPPATGAGAGEEDQPNGISATPAPCPTHQFQGRRSKIPHRQRAMASGSGAGRQRTHARKAKAFAMRCEAEDARKEALMAKGWRGKRKGRRNQRRKAGGGGGAGKPSASSARAEGGGRALVKKTRMVVFVKWQSEAPTVIRATTFPVKPTTTVEQIKEEIEDYYDVKGIFTANQLRLVCAGKTLHDGQTLADYNIQHEATIHVMLRLRGGRAGGAPRDEDGPATGGGAPRDEDGPATGGGAPREEEEAPREQEAPSEGEEEEEEEEEEAPIEGGAEQEEEQPEEEEQEEDAPPATGAGVGGEAPAPADEATPAPGGADQVPTWQTARVLLAEKRGSRSLRLTLALASVQETERLLGVLASGTEVLVREDLTDKADAETRKFEGMSRDELRGLARNGVLKPFGADGNSPNAVIVRALKEARVAGATQHRAVVNKGILHPLYGIVVRTTLTLHTPADMGRLFNVVKPGTLVQITQDDDTEEEDADLPEIDGLTREELRGLARNGALKAYGVHGNSKSDDIRQALRDSRAGRRRKFVYRKVFL